MSSYQELRALSLDFRRMSSNLLNATNENGDVQLTRFKNAIDNIPFISELISKTIADIDYNFKECFIIDNSDWHEISPPVSEAFHIKAQYDYITYICESNVNVLGSALGFYHPSNTYDDIIQEFMQNAFKPLIDFINDSISKEMMILEDEIKHIPSMIQNIGSVYGTAVQGTGTVSAVNTTNINDVSEIVALLNALTKEVDNLSIPDDVSCDIKDDLEVISEQVQSTTPKKSRLQRAVNGLKKFVSEFTMKYAVSVAVSTDWAALINKVETFITNLG